MTGEAIGDDHARQATHPYLPVGVAGAVAAVAAALPFPIEFYLTFRSIIAGCAVTLAYTAWKLRRRVWFLAGLTAAVLWVPHVLNLPKSAWILLDLAAAALFLVGGFTLRQPRDNGSAAAGGRVLAVAFFGTLAILMLFGLLSGSGNTSSGGGPDCTTEVDYVPATVCE